MNVFVQNLRRTVKRLLPAAVLQIIQERRERLLSRRLDYGFAGQTPAEVFSAVYENAIWGRQADGSYSSGSGSHDPALIGPYIDAVRKFLASFPSPPSVVDLGCGDFNVGCQIRSCCDAYIACDVVPSLVARNKSRFADLKVDFRGLDIVTDELPDGDIVFLRQVLQHLRNDQIAVVLPKIKKFRYLVLTEHLPMRDSFVPNLEKPTGPGIRLGIRSGVVLTESPFSLAFKSRRDICWVAEKSAVILTTIYQIH